MEVTFEKDGRIYLVASVAPLVPTEQEIEDLAFAKPIRDQAPNPQISWYRGQYVEADKPNLNGVMWAGPDLAIASVTPLLMPVTVMHDPRTAVGLIADTRLVMRGEGVPRSRLDTTLAVWKHRFPETEEEAQHNYRAGTLMQSMECLSSHYDCSSCGKSFVRQPDWAEKANWCEHLADQASSGAARTLRNVCFTGTGLIFGSRGARGAYSEAHLEPLMEEVAAFHQEARHTSRNTRPKPKHKTTRRNKVELDDKRYEELIASEQKLKTSEARLADLEPKLAKSDEDLATANKKVDQLEIDKKKAEDDHAAEKAKRETLEETARASTLASERTGKLGTAFMAKLPEGVKTRLAEQAKTMKDEDWTARLDELAEMTGVKHDEAAAEGAEGQGAGTFSREEVARAQLGNGGTSSSGGAVTAERRRSVVAGLIKPPTGAAK